MTVDPEGESEAMYGLVMPFVACVDQGGPYDADAFVAGYEGGTINMTLQAMSGIGGFIERWVKPDLVPQLDLIAMRHDQKLATFEMSEDGHWIRVRIGHPALVDETEGAGEGP